MCFKMPLSKNPHNINLLDLKTKITEALGPGRANQYFAILGQFFSCKLSKAELDRKILSAIGREHLSLHNQLIWAIWTNATSDKAPPLALNEAPSGAQIKHLSTKVTESAPSPQGPQSPSQATRANGFIVTVSPKKGRSGVRDRKAKDKQSMLVHFKGEASTSRETTTDEGKGKGLNDGVVESSEMIRRLEHTQDSAQPLDSNDVRSWIPHAKRMKVASPKQMDLPSTERAHGESSVVQIGTVNRVVKAETSTISVKPTIRAPLGVPFCVGSTRELSSLPTVNRSLSLNYTLLGNCRDEESSDLPDVDSLKRRMDRIAVLEGGLEGVSHESVVCLNQALDIHLKKLITGSIELMKSRHSTDKQGGSSTVGGSDRDEVPSSAKLLPSFNGLWPNQSPSVSANLPQDAGKHEEKNNLPVMPIDFKVAMENRPQQLGENWPTILERLSFRVFEQHDKQYRFGP